MGTEPCFSICLESASLAVYRSGCSNGPCRSPVGFHMASGRRDIWATRLATCLELWPKRRVQQLMEFQSQTTAQKAVHRDSDQQAFWATRVTACLELRT